MTDVNKLKTSDSPGDYIFYSAL